MTRFGKFLAFAVFGAALAASGPASAAEVGCWYNGGLHPCIWYPGYAYAPLPVAPLPIVETAPLMTGRSVAVEAGAGVGNYCATPVKTCRLYESAWLGTGCSCRVYGGYERGFVQ
ncbi:hypothetical protein RZS28_14765 [Methylocapsa polymorpha]|uniref:Uncharacterized protein n=1 Tax=Methylocapsa polymorpha TaxID=3080828 RepID=A0ABZ0HR30_9HYPH|nr:hypothetical protein RZS28_14765 [Methylocapsa sp. RX1]